MSDIKFVKGLNIKTYNGQYGDILNCGINIKKLQEENELNDGWLNFKIKKGKETGKWYAEIDTWKPEKKEEPKEEENIVKFNEQIDDESIPF